MSKVPFFEGYFMIDPIEKTCQFDIMVIRIDSDYTRDNGSGRGMGEDIVNSMLVLCQSVNCTSIFFIRRQFFLEPDWYAIFFLIG